MTTPEKIKSQDVAPDAPQQAAEIELSLPKEYERIFHGLLLSTGRFVSANPLIKSRPSVPSVDNVKVMVRQLDAEQAIKDPRFWRTYEAMSKAARYEILHAVRTFAKIDLDVSRPEQNQDQAQ